MPNQIISNGRKRQAVPGQMRGAQAYVEAKRLKAGEDSVAFKVRASTVALSAFGRLSSLERGAVVEAWFAALEKD